MFLCHLLTTYRAMRSLSHRARFEVRDTRILFASPYASLQVSLLAVARTDSNGLKVNELFIPCFVP